MEAPGPDMKDPAVRAALREERKKANQAKHAKLQAELRAEHKAFIEAREPPLPIEIDWSTRPKQYTPEVAQMVCERIATSSRSMGTLCREEGMPSLATLYRWLDSELDFAQKYARARNDQTDFLAEECLEIANTQHPGDKVTTSTKDGVKITREDMLGHRTLQIETRKWFISKMHPKKYGTQKVQLGNDPDNPLPGTFDPDNLTDAQLADIATKRALETKAE